MKERKGYVFQTNGKWYARITLTDSTGKRRNIKRTANSKSDAKNLLRSILRQLEDEGVKVIDNWQITFNALADYYENNYAIPAKFVDGQKIQGLRDLVSVKNYLKVYRKHFGNRKLRDISYDNLAVFRAVRLETPTYHKKSRTVTSVNRELAYLRRMFSIAIEQGWILKNPFNCGKPLILVSCEKRRERILSLDEEIRLIDACNNFNRQHLRPLLIALLDTGARKGEIIKLIWRDVDLERNLITFQAMNTKTLKTRQVGITRRLRIELQRLRDKPDQSDESLVFGITNNVRKSFATACKIAGIKHGGLDGLTLHCLRHTAATRLVKGQMPIQMVGRILGHTQVNTTYRYLTADTETIKQAADVLESYQQNTLIDATDYIN